MQVNNVSQRLNSQNFGAIYKFNYEGKECCESILDVVKIYAQGNRINEEHQLGVGEMYFYIPNSKVSDLVEQLNQRFKHEAYAKHFTKVD